MHDFDTQVNRRNTKSEKWDTLDQLADLPFTVADTDFPVPTPILEAIRERADHPILGYTLLEDGFYKAITGFVERRHGWSLQKDWIHITPGVMVGVGVALDAWTQEGDGVIIQTPVYTPFFRVIEKNNRRLLTNPLRLEEGGFRIDFPHLEKAMQEAKVLLLCNPHNPTGRVFEEWELQKIAGLAEKHQVKIISDEIHSDLIYPGQTHIPIATVSPYVRDHSLTMIAPSKTFNIPGLSTSVAILPGDDLRHRFVRKLRALGLHEGNTFGIVALEAAYTRCDGWLEDLKGYLEKNRDQVMAWFGEHLPQVRIFPPQGTYLMWLDFSAYGEHGDILHRLLAANVVLTDGLIYGEEGRGWLRLNIGCPRSTLDEGLKRIGTALEVR